jgi:excisionase family DNA binding protein
VRPRTVERWMKQGRLPYYKLGRAVRFKWSEVVAHLARTFLVAQKGPERWS